MAPRRFPPPWSVEDIGVVAAELPIPRAGDTKRNTFNTPSVDVTSAANEEPPE
jgi:hypothetical protein